jgi:hypothetical protein
LDGDKKEDNRKTGNNYRKKFREQTSAMLNLRPFFLSLQSPTAVVQSTIRLNVFAAHRCRQIIARRKCGREEAGIYNLIYGA